METWDATFYPEYPNNWLLNAFYASHFCSPSPLSGFKTGDAHSGQWAAKLEAVSCWNDMFIEQTYIGIMAAGDVNTFQHLFYGIACSQRPVEMRFYYKYHGEGGDTALARIRLVTLDSVGNIEKIVGDGTMPITSDVASYTLARVPVTYYYSDTPDVMQLVFSTSKTLTDINYLNAPKDVVAHSGTTLWIDDIDVPGMTVGAQAIASGGGMWLYPNPVVPAVSVTFDNALTGGHSLHVFDALGRSYETIAVTGRNTQVNTAGWPNGLYFLHLHNGVGQMLCAEKLIVQH